MGNFGTDLIQAFEAGRRARMEREDRERQRQEREEARKFQIDEYKHKIQGLKLDRQKEARGLQEGEAQRQSNLPPQMAAQTPVGTSIPEGAVTRTAQWPEMQRVLSAGLPQQEQRPADVELGGIEGILPPSRVNPADIRAGRTREAEEKSRREIAEKVAGRTPPALRPVNILGPDGKPTVANYNPATGETSVGGQVVPKPQPLPSATNDFKEYVKDIEEEKGSPLTAMERIKARKEWAASGKVSVSVGVGRDFNQAGALRDDYARDLKQINFPDIASSYGRIKASANNQSPAGDLSMIYSYMKMLDPGSVVRETEFRIAATAKPLLERVGLNWDAVKNVWAGNRLTSSQRADFMQRATAIYEPAAQQKAEIDAHYRGIAERNRLNPADVIQGGAEPIVQRNKATGAFRHSLDGGKTWRNGKP